MNEAMLFKFGKCVDCDKSEHIGAN